MLPQKTLILLQLIFFLFVSNPVKIRDQKK